jgi:hypothetical protein
MFFFVALGFEPVSGIEGPGEVFLAMGLPLPTSRGTILAKTCKANQALDVAVNIAPSLYKSTLETRFRLMSSEEFGMPVLQHKYIVEWHTAALQAKLVEACVSNMRRLNDAVLAKADEFAENVVSEVRALSLLLDASPITFDKAAVDALRAAIDSASGNDSIASVLVKFPIHGKPLLDAARARVAGGTVAVEWHGKMESVMQRDHGTFETQNFGDSVKTFSDLMADFTSAPGDVQRHFEEHQPTDYRIIVQTLAASGSAAVRVGVASWVPYHRGRFPRPLDPKQLLLGASNERGEGWAGLQRILC